MGLQVRSLIDDILLNEVENDEKNLQWAEYITESHKFVIRNTMEIVDQKIIDYSLLLMENRILNLPFEKCYFEFQNYSIKQNVAAFGVAAIETDQAIVTKTFIRCLGSDLWNRYYHGAGWKKTDGTFACGPNFYGPSGDPGSESFVEDEIQSTTGALLIAAAIAFMDLREVEKTEINVSERINSKRIRRGKKRLFDHTELFVKSTAKAAAIAKMNTLIQKRAHWRRGHLRHLPGGVVPVRPTLVRGEGFLSKDYVI